MVDNVFIHRLRRFLRHCPNELLVTSCFRHLASYSLFVISYSLFTGFSTNGDTDAFFRRLPVQRLQHHRHGLILRIVEVNQAAHDKQFQTVGILSLILWILGDPVEGLKQSPQQAVSRKAQAGIGCASANPVCRAGQFRCAASEILFLGIPYTRCKS